MRDASSKIGGAESKGLEVITLILENFFLHSMISSCTFILYAKN